MNAVQALHGGDYPDSGRQTFSSEHVRTSLQRVLLHCRRARIGGTPWPKAGIEQRMLCHRPVRGALSCLAWEALTEIYMNLNNAIETEFNFTLTPVIEGI